MEYEPLSTTDREMIEGQLSRKLRGGVFLGSRCPYGVPQVLVTSPLLDDGTPFPTLFWLTCPLLKRAVSRLESMDFREGIREKLKDGKDFSEALSRAEMSYAEERDRWADRLGETGRAGEYFRGKRGIGGTSAGGTKCLHAHLAHFLAKGENPVGAEVARALDGWQEERCEGSCEPFLKGGRGA